MKLDNSQQMDIAIIISNIPCALASRQVSALVLCFLTKLDWISKGGMTG